MFVCVCVYLFLYTFLLTVSYSFHCRRCGFVRGRKLKIPLSFNASWTILIYFPPRRITAVPPLLCSVDTVPVFVWCVSCTVVSLPSIHLDPCVIFPPELHRCVFLPSMRGHSPTLLNAILGSFVCSFRGYDLF